MCRCFGYMNDGATFFKWKRSLAGRETQEKRSRNNTDTHNKRQKPNRISRKQNQNINAQNDVVYMCVFFFLSFFSSTDFVSCVIIQIRQFQNFLTQPECWIYNRKKTHWFILEWTGERTSSRTHNHWVWSGTDDQVSSETHIINANGKSDICS